jgi:LmbE family N-acetylglucosaminyl deacetylase
MTIAIAIAAHPDDIELFMSGTLILLRAAGCEIHYMNVANGCCGTTKYDAETIARMRRAEASAAASSIGATFHESICDDIGIFYDRPTISRMASTIRQVAPDIVLTHAPADYMSSGGHGRFHAWNAEFRCGSAHAAN